MAKYEVEDWETKWNKAKTKEEREQALKEYGDAKLRNATRREEERLNKPGLLDMLLGWTMGKKKVKQKMTQEKKQEKVIIRDNQNSR